MNPLHTFTDRRNQLRLAIHIIRRYLATHPDVRFRVEQPRSRKGYAAYLYTDEDTTIYTSGHKRRLDAIVTAATEIATETLPVVALWVVLDWITEHEASFIIDQFIETNNTLSRRFLAQVAVPVQIVAAEYDATPEDAITELAYSLAKLPEGATESI